MSDSILLHVLLRRRCWTSRVATELRWDVNAGGGDELETCRHKIICHFRACCVSRGAKSPTRCVATTTITSHTAGSLLQGDGVSLINHTLLIHLCGGCGFFLWGFSVGTKNHSWGMFSQKLMFIYSRRGCNFRGSSSSTLSAPRCSLRLTNRSRMNYNFNFQRCWYSLGNMFSQLVAAGWRSFNGIIICRSACDRTDQNK